MNWMDVGKLIAPLAPTLGSILGGFIPIPGGALAGQAIGSIIARQFGVPATPEAVSDAIKRADADVAIEKLKAAAEVSKAEVDGVARVFEAESRIIVSSLEQTGQTMRLEILPENRHWFFTGWRPACGWIFAVMSAAFGVLMIMATVEAMKGNSTPLKVMADAWPTYAVYFGMLGLMVGVYVYARSKDKESTAVVKAATAAKK